MIRREDKNALLPTNTAGKKGMKVLRGCAAGKVFLKEYTLLSIRQLYIAFKGKIGKRTPCIILFVITIKHD